MADVFRLVVDGRVLDVLYSSFDEAVKQAVVIFSSAGVDVYVVNNDGEQCWPRPGASPGKTKDQRNK
jgi:hypothetical protein